MNSRIPDRPDLDPDYEPADYRAQGDEEYHPDLDQFQQMQEMEEAERNNYEGDLIEDCAAVAPVSTLKADLYNSLRPDPRDFDFYRDTYNLGKY